MTPSQFKVMLPSLYTFLFIISWKEGKMKYDDFYPEMQEFLMICCINVYVFSVYSLMVILSSYPFQHRSHLQIHFLTVMLGREVTS